MNQASESLSGNAIPTTMPEPNLSERGRANFSNFPDISTLHTTLKMLPGAPTVDEKEPFANQDQVVKELERLGVVFPTEDGIRLEPLDPDKFYIAFVDGPLDRQAADSMGGFFKGKKGGLMFLNKKDSLRGYALEDLRSMKEGLDVLIGMLEKSNKVQHSRFDIIKDGS